jgi:hypothetical protein
MRYRIQIEIEAADRDEALLLLERKLDWLRKAGWPEQYQAGGGGGGPDFSVYIGQMSAMPTRYRDALPTPTRWRWRAWMPSTWLQNEDRNR